MSEQEPKYQTRDSINGGTSGVRPAPFEGDAVHGPPMAPGSRRVAVEYESPDHGSCGSPRLGRARRPSMTQRGDHEPFERGRRYVPVYYRQVRRNRLIDPSADVHDFLDVYAIDRPLRADAIGYLIRAGRKAGNPAVKDLTKALEVIQREIEYLESGEAGVFVSHVPGLSEVAMPPGGVEPLVDPWDDVSGHEVSR